MCTALWHDFTVTEVLTYMMTKSAQYSDTSEQNGTCYLPVLAAKSCVFGALNARIFYARGQVRKHNYYATDH